MFPQILEQLAWQDGEIVLLKNKIIRQAKLFNDAKIIT